MMIGERKPEFKGEQAEWTPAERERRRQERLRDQTRELMREQLGGMGAVCWCIGAVAIALAAAVLLLIRACM